MEILESNGVDFTAFQFEGKARRWWQAYFLSRLAGLPSLTWDQFTYLFLEKYIPPSEREELRGQFERLRQGHRSITDYEARFTDLSRHASIILPTDAERVQRDATILFDPWSTYSYVSSLFARFLGVPHESLGTPLYVSMPVGNSVIVDRIYRSCIMTFCGYETRADLLLLDMNDFEVILGMDWLSLYHVVLDFHAKTVTLVILELHRLELKGSSISASSQVISYLQARHMVEEGCLAYLAYVRDTSTETPMTGSVPMVRVFSDVFPSDLPGMPPDRDIDFCIDLVPGEGIKVDPGKIDVVQSWSRPTTATENRLLSPGGAKEVTIGEDDVLWLQGRLCIPNVDGLREKILEEAHSSRYSIHPGTMKMYRDLRQYYWWRRMKKDIVEYMARCLNFQQVKYEHQRPGGLLQQMVIPEWKRERNTMDFVIGLSRTLKKFDAFWVIIDRLTKSAHFIPMVTTYSS
ncbi:uncharacterized protein [Nicotiana tomentosiformis]|uniref:uncharacterized protein n=1 Tax=Nicotiana tomentosiformis TaxID=4098 RepID=UPI00388CDF29